MMSSLDKSSAIKIFTTISALILLLISFTTVFEMIKYTQTIVCLYLAMFSLVIILLNISPYITEAYISKVFPFLTEHLGRAAVYVIVASFCFADEFGSSGKFNGVLMFICAALSVYNYAYAPLIPPNTNIQIYYPEEA